MEKPGRTLLAKIWDQHVIARIGDDTDLLHVDRHLLHDLGGSRGLLDLKSRKLSVHNPDDLAIAGLFVTLATTEYGGVGDDAA
jgi:3-isopropylmalate/(R)-2-methylmalate dehydratase large subunit